MGAIGPHRATVSLCVALARSGSRRVASLGLQNPMASLWRRGGMSCLRFCFQGVEVKRSLRTRSRRRLCEGLSKMAAEVVTSPTRSVNQP
jgi:hypothetical protein